MIASKIIQAALALIGEEPDRDILTRNISVTLINTGLAELMDAENMFRENDEMELLTEPVTISKPEDNVPYDFHITSIILPYWLAWHFWAARDDTSRAESFHVLYDQAVQKWVPAVWVPMTDNNDLWRHGYEA